MMKVLFAGYGSIARRHIMNLEKICETRNEPLVIDLLRHAPSETPAGIRQVFTMASDLDDEYDAIFVTNPTSSHYETLLSLIDRSDFFFVEKPVFDSAHVDIAPFIQEGKFFHVACPLRFSSVIQWIRDNIACEDVLGIRSISSSYLPEWRPGIDYRQTYSARAELGGGVEIDLIHELDYVCFLLGRPTSVQSFMGKISDLEIDTNDIALYIFDFSGKTAEVHIDYFGRAPMRRLEVFTTEETFVCDLITAQIHALRSGEVIDLGEQRNDFQIKELEYFLDCLESRTMPDNDLEEAVWLLDLAKTGKMAS